MKVYTHFYFDTNSRGKEEGFRWRTILQFGDSWEIKGSVVMKNPGSAGFKDARRRPISSPELLDRLREFDYKYLETDWYEFTDDNTLRCVASLFSDYYDARGEELEGVIQVFDLFYNRDANLDMALQKNRAAGQFPDLTEYDIAHLVAPVYLGFGRLAFDRDFTDKARAFFDAAKALGAEYLNDNFYKNKFYHPQYLKNYGKNKVECFKAIDRFVSNSRRSSLRTDNKL